MKKTTLNELMGKKGADGAKGNLSLDDLGELLGERLPKLEFTPVGRLRLTTALRNRFGEGWRNLPGIESVLKEFDEEARFNVRKMEMKMIKPKKRV